MASRSTKASTDVDRLVGGRIRLARRAAGLSQARLGDAIGVTFQQVQKYENGTNRVTLGRLHRIASAVGTSFSDLTGNLEGVGHGVAGDDEFRKFMTTRGSRDLVQAWMALTPALRLRAPNRTLR